LAKGSSANGSAGSLELSDKNLFFCAAEVKDDKKQTPQEELLTKNGYKAFLEKDYKGAEKQYKELLDLEKKLHGADSKEVARTLDALGSACEKDERYADAKGYYKQGAEVCAKAYGKDVYKRQGFDNRGHVSLSILSLTCGALRKILGLEFVPGGFEVLSANTIRFRGDVYKRQGHYRTPLKIGRRLQMRELHVEGIAYVIKSLLS